MEREKEGDRKRYKSSTQKRQEEKIEGGWWKRREVKDIRRSHKSLWLVGLCSYTESEISADLPAQIYGSGRVNNSQSLAFHGNLTLP